MLPDACRQLIVSSQKIRGNFALLIHSHKKFVLMVLERQYQPYSVAAFMNQLLNPCAHIISLRNNMPAQDRHKLLLKFLMVTTNIF